MPTYTIGDLVKRDLQAEFRNDVQLSSYDDKKRNMSLVRSYMFTTMSPMGTSAATAILHSATQAFLSERLENRFVVIANFGHGKSHLALALANYFGKPIQFDEFKTVMEKIGKAYSGSSSATHFQQFKESRGEFLVVRVRGDVAGSLREQFLNSLEKALGEHTVTRDHHLPGWYAKAEKYLTSLQAKDAKKANIFLEQHETDIPMLTQDVKRKRDKAYDLFVKLYAHLDENGFKPDMGGELSLADAVKWASKEFCGDSKPLGGMVILFDEFSLYVSNYAQRSAAGDLQDMLNGVSDCQGKVVFMAFAQQDPITVAQNALAGANVNQRDSLLKELTRIPQKFILHSLMESVIDSYLEQPEDKWRNFAQERTVSLLISQATSIAHDQFKEHYEKLGWTSVEKFQEAVTKGCFPLHPITTALLCSMQFQQSVSASGTPRNILGFILEQLERIQEQPAIIGKHINWVLPIYLVDYFGERLPADRYHAYQQAVERTKADDEGAFSAEEQIDCLKALLLQEVAGLKKARDEDQIDLIASMIGMPPSDTKKCLRSLSDTKVIAWNQDGRRSYNLWASSFNPYKLDQILARKVAQVDITWRDLLALSKEQLRTTPVSIPWGHSQDWQAPEYMVTAEFFNSKTLKDLVSQYSHDARTGLQEGDRGCIVWLIAQNEDEVASLRKCAQKTLDDGFPQDAPLPVILMLPAQPNPFLIDSVRNHLALDAFTPTDKEESGQDIYRVRLAQESANILQAIQSMRGGENYRDASRWSTHFVVPSAYRARVQQLGQISLSKLLEECYRLAYRFSPPEFFVQYTLSGRGNANLRAAMKSVATDILHSDSVSLSGTLRTNAIARDMVQKILYQKWQIVTADNRIKPPDESSIVNGWELLDKTFPAGEQDIPVKPVLLSLLNPPYGYDYNTLVLLFCAWFGYNAQDLQVGANGKVSGIKQLDEWLEAGPKEFITYLLAEKATIARRDATKATREIKKLLAKVKEGGFTQDDAQNAVNKLEDFVSNSKNDATLIDDARKAISNINGGLAIAEQYESQTKKITDAIGREKSIRSLSHFLEILGGLAESTLVVANAPTTSDLRNKLQKWMEQVVLEQCATLENIRELTAFELHRRELETLKSDLSRLKMPILAERADEAIDALEKNAEVLQSHQREAGIQSEIRGMRPNAPLKDLLDWRTRLNKMGTLSADTQKLCDAQLKMIQSEIKKMEGFVEDADEELGRIDSKQAFEEWRSVFLSRLPRLDDTPLSKKVQKLQGRVEQLRVFFEELSLAEASPLRTADDVDDANQRLQNIEKKYAKQISDRQKKLVEKAAGHIEKRVRDYESQATSMLEGLETSFAKGVKLADLRAQLERPIPFLPEKASKRLAGLTQRVDQKLDEDVVSQIEFQFRKIKDEKLRKQCLKRLHEIVDEKK